MCIRDRQKSALLPVLHLAQQHFGGWLDVPVMDYVASLLTLDPIEAVSYTHLQCNGPISICKFYGAGNL